MKKAMAGILLLFCAITASADAFQTFTSIVNFNTTLKELSENPGSIDPNHLYLLDGTISAIHLLKTEAGKFQAELEFMNSEWIGTKSIKTYRIILVMSKPGFATLFPEKVGQAPGPGQIGPNMRALALVQYGNSGGGNFIVHEFRILR